jgi:hypothetical protein
MADFDAIAKAIMDKGPALVDLTKPAHMDLCEVEATALLEMARSKESAVKFLNEMRDAMVAKKDDWSYFTHLVNCCALSKAIIQDCKKPAHVSMCFAVYGEVNRICTSDASKKTDFIGVHENGEDFLRNKVKQLDWVTEGSQVTWSIMVCDDGCNKPWTLPNGESGEGSGKIIEKVAAGECAGKDIKVVYLADGIDAKDPICAGMATPKDSRKGGAVHWAMHNALKEFKESGKKGKHMIAYTDADLSTHLGQTGLLLKPLLSGKVCGVGSRRHPYSIMVKTGARNVRGVVNAFLWKQMLQEVGYVVDTQTAFKGFDASVVSKIIDGNLKERAFGFDVELLLKAHVEAEGPGKKKEPLENVPICWQDSEAESQSGTDSGGDAYVKLLQGFAAVYRNNLPKESWRESFALFLDELDENSWDKFLKDCPAGIADKTAKDFTPDYKDVDANMCRKVCGMKTSMELMLSQKRGSNFYVRAATSFLKGVEATEDKAAKEPVDTIRLTALGNSIGAACTVAAKVESDGIGKITSLKTAYPEMQSGRGCGQIIIDIARV